jgi:hypothetical protein
MAVGAGHEGVPKRHRWLPLLGLQIVLPADSRIAAVIYAGHTTR